MVYTYSVITFSFEFRPAVFTVRDGGEAARPFVFSPLLWSFFTGLPFGAPLDAEGFSLNGPNGLHDFVRQAFGLPQDASALTQEQIEQFFQHAFDVNGEF